MDIVSAAFTLTIGILHLMAEQDSKHIVMKQLAGTVQQIQDNIAPLLSNPQVLAQNQPLNRSLRALLVALSDTNFHLRLWTETRSHRFIASIHPGSATEQLKDDNGHLMNQYLMLIGAVQFVDHIHGYNVISSNVISSNRRNTTQPPSIVNYLSPSKAATEEVKSFWNRYVGSEVS